MLRKFDIPRTLPSSILGLLHVLVLVYLNEGILFLEIGIMQVLFLVRVSQIVLVGMGKLCCLWWRAWIYQQRSRREM